LYRARRRRYRRAGGDRNIAFGDAATNAAIGRIAFGTGAIIIWLCTAAFAAFGFRKLFDHAAPSAG
jgi:hypothetical protein